MPNIVPACLTALGRQALPTKIDVGRNQYVLRRVFKNDFFAITAMYEGRDRRVFLKINRTARFGILPMRWVGRVLAAKEVAAFARLADVTGIPKMICRWGDTGLVREYIEGHPLTKGEAVSDDFHRHLAETVDEIHRRGMACVDLEKCENVLVSEHGRPYLFDFQISWYVPRRWGGELWPLTVLRRWFQQGDRYHLLKLQRRTRPDQLSSELLAASYRKPWYVRFHGVLTRPVTWCRRKVLDRVDPRRRPGEHGRVDEDVIGVR